MFWWYCPPIYILPPICLPPPICPPVVVYWPWCPPKWVGGGGKKSEFVDNDPEPTPPADPDAPVDDDDGDAQYVSGAEEEVEVVGSNFDGG